MPKIKVVAKKHQKAAISPKNSPVAAVKPGFSAGRKKTVATIQTPEERLLEAIFSGGSHSGMLRTAMEKMELVREGVSKRELENLKERTGLDYDDLAVVLPATRATLISRKGNEKFNASVSDAIVSLADIYSHGYEVFGDKERFNDWMFRPLQALNGETPFSLLDNQFGREEVRDLIGRIEYGVYS